MFLWGWGCGGHGWGTKIWGEVGVGGDWRGLGKAGSIQIVVETATIDLIPMDEKPWPGSIRMRLHIHTCSHFTIYKHSFYPMDTSSRWYQETIFNKE